MGTGPKKGTDLKVETEVAPLAYSVDEAAQLLRVHPDTVRAMIRRKELPEVRYARRVWIPRTAITEMFSVKGQESA